MCQFIESIRIQDGMVCRLAYHEERVRHTRAAFWGDVPELDLRQWITPRVPLPGVYKCRMVYGREVKEVSFQPYQLRPVASLRLVVDDVLDYTYKSVDRSRLNDLFGRRGMADDVLIVRQGLLTDTSIANVALYDGVRWYTPARPLLKGTQRAALLDQGQMLESDIPAAELGCYSHIMLFNAMIEWGELVLPVNAVRWE